MINSLIYTLLSGSKLASRRMSSQSFDPLGIYLREIGRIDRLLPEQEIVYARQIKSMLAQNQQNNLLMQRLKRSPTAAELAAEVNKTEAELTQI